jgi:hypothetical protein
LSPSDKIHALVPVFDWSWWQIYLFALAIDWGAILVIMRFERLGWGLLPGTSIRIGPGNRQFFPSFIYGDLFLPLGIASSAVALRHFNSPEAWYASRWFNWLVLGAGVVISLIFEILAIGGKRFTWKQELAPSKVWHTIAFVLLFYLAVMTVIPLLVTRDPAWAAILAFVGYLGWAICVYLDGKIGPDIRYAH